MAEQYQITGDTSARIVASIEDGIRLGFLESGSRLPPVRALARQLAVAPATVAVAYRRLRERGIVETDGRRGTRIRRRSRAHHRAATLPPGVVDLANGEPDPELLPDLTAAVRRVPTTAANYRQAGPDPRLVALARRRLLADGVDGTITITGGALDGIDRTLAALLRPGDTVAIEDPCWANLRDLVVAGGMRPVPVPVDEAGPTPDGLAAALRGGVAAAVVTGRAHNPTGAVITAARAARLREVIAEHPETLIIEDDHWAELSHDRLHPVADAAHRWMFLRSVSKPYGPDLRLAVAAGDPATVAAVEGRTRIGSGWVSTILQHLVMALWEDPHTTETLAHARDRYRHRRTAVLDALRRHGIDATGRTGLNIWVPVADEAYTVAALRDAGYAVAPGSGYRIDSPPAIRVTVARLDPDHAEALAAAIAAAVRPRSPLT